MGAKYILGTAILAIGSEPFPWSDSDLITGGGVAFWCTRCAEAWGKVYTTPIQPDAELFPILRLCARHGRDRDYGGSFLHPWTRNFSFLPPEVLAYEADLRLNHKEVKYE